MQNWCDVVSFSRKKPLGGCGFRGLAVGEPIKPRERFCVAGELLIQPFIGVQAFHPFREGEYQVSSGSAAQGMNGQGFVTGHDFSRAARPFSLWVGFSP
jgi:hypothetical protein